MKKSFGHPPAQQPQQSPAPRQMIGWDGLRARGIHYNELYLRKMWNANPPRFPKPFKPSPRKLCWWADEVDAWMAKAATQKGMTTAE